MRGEGGGGLSVWGGGESPRGKKENPRPPRRRGAPAEKIIPSVLLLAAETHAEGRHAQQIHHDNTQIDRMNPHCAGDYTYLVLRPTLFFGLRRRTRPRLASLARTSAVLMVRPCLTAISPFLIMPA